MIVPPKTKADARANFYEWAAGKGLDDHYLDQVDRKWRKLGAQAAQPAGLRNAPHP